jgi:hypothetical protein
VKNIQHHGRLDTIAVPGVHVTGSAFSGMAEIRDSGKKQGRLWYVQKSGVENVNQENPSR